VVDLADLTTVKPAVEKFLEKEEKLHVLVHNAGVMVPPEGSKTTQVCEHLAGSNLDVCLVVLIRCRAMTL